MRFEGLTAVQLAGGFFDFVMRRRGQVLVKTLEHIRLTALAVAIAALLAVLLSRLIWWAERRVTIWT